MNIVVLLGRLVKNPDLQEINVSGKLTKLTKNTIAVKRLFKNQNGEYECDFFDFNLWGVTAEYLCNYAEKGSAIVLKGRIQNRKYTDNFGNEKQVTEIIGEGVELLSKPKEQKPKVEEKTLQDFNTDPCNEYEKTVYKTINEDDLPF